ncbi:hypothetical protein [Parerythrobacter lacustris]|uniref:Uncharacterized protein n=1 Tax=Parerythrobacter lacustris TaxID=2969984 RepID=A0ABT1XU92_9SPHN|nr:hypothetical protein [Parerythrobacter lacustris]MCR2835234.1 hypothetical protein [Parerythrobacter lacustris]
MLFDLEAYAIKRAGFPLAVCAKAELSNSCYEARIADKFPGGDVEYSADPAVAQVIIEVVRYDRLCFQSVVPWAEAVMIWNAERYDAVDLILRFTRENEEGVEEETLRVPIERI